MSFGELVLILGDLHVPQRALAIPEKFKRMLLPNKMQHVICTGNLGCRERYDELRDLAPNIHVVMGDYEGSDVLTPITSSSLSPLDGDGGLSTSAVFPETRVVQVGDFRIGVIHGHQVIPWGDHAALDATARKLDVDILVSGHTHRNAVVEYGGRFHINPGSITGAFSPVGVITHSSSLRASSTEKYDIIPSFVLLAVQGSKVVCYVYELINGDVDVSKTEFSKGGKKHE